MGTDVHVSNDVTREKVVIGIITEATTLTAATSGTTYVLPAATAGAAITLPALAAGLNFKFIVTGLIATTSWTIVTADAAKVLYGIANVNSVAISGSLETTVSLVHDSETIGDYANFVCDGTFWYVDGMAFAAGGLTFTGA
jgi:hypothetical protein